MIAFDGKCQVEAREVLHDMTLEIRRPSDQSAQKSEGSKDRYLVIALLRNVLNRAEGK